MSKFEPIARPSTDGNIWVEFNFQCINLSDIKRFLLDEHECKIHFYFSDTMKTSFSFSTEKEAEDYYDYIISLLNANVFEG